MNELSPEFERDYPCKYGHNYCAVKEGGHCFDEMETLKEQRQNREDDLVSPDNSGR